MQSPQRQVTIDGMSENITHTAIVDDCIRLIQADPSQPAILGEVMSKHHDLARMGGITRSGDKCNPGLLSTARDQIAAGNFSSDGRDGQKLAFVLGWLTHRAADRTVKKVFRDLDGDCPLSPRDASIYNDACVLREVYHLVQEPYDKDLFKHEADEATAGLNAERFAGLERLVQIALQRNLIAIHTLIPATEDPDQWLDALIARFQTIRVDLKRYADAVFKPDPDMWRRFITDCQFYDQKDPWIAQARALQQDAQSGWQGEPGDHCSIYGKALQRAVGYVRAAGAFLHQDMQEDELLDRLEIGRPELAG